MLRSGSPTRTSAGSVSSSVVGAVRAFGKSAQYAAMASMSRLERLAARASMIALERCPLL
jgi:hypothetical protein